MKEVIAYAENPDKTTSKEYLDDDLYNALSYVENDDKTDRQIYVDTINCSKRNAYGEMVAVQSVSAAAEISSRGMGFKAFRQVKSRPTRRSRSGKRPLGERGEISIRSS